MGENKKICTKCGRELPLGQFRLYYNNTVGKKVYRGECIECEKAYVKKYMDNRRKKKSILSDNIEIIFTRKYKEIDPARILDVSTLPVVLLGTDEIFVKLMDFKDCWLSNYGRVIRKSGKAENVYSLLQGSYDSGGKLRYTLPKNKYIAGKWVFQRTVVYAAQMVVETFIVNYDKLNNTHIWHSGNNKEDNYYRNLYPLTERQYYAVRAHYNEMGEDSEEYIVNVMNDICYKPDDWSKKCIAPRMCSIGYWGAPEVDCKSKAYIKWHDMLSRCYLECEHRRVPRYVGCSVCEEWLNFQNFKIWYDSHNYGNMELDKDILFKGNMIYSPETCCLVPAAINTLFINGKAARNNLPVGVFYEKAKNKYRASMAYKGSIKKLGTFDDPESAFQMYKEYKEDFIREMAGKHYEKIPYNVYIAMMNWQIEITD